MPNPPPPSWWGVMFCIDKNNGMGCPGRRENFISLVLYVGTILQHTKFILAQETGPGNVALVIGPKGLGPLVSIDLMHMTS